MILQPKRWQDASDPKYDPIRHKPWFARLLKRKQIMPLMEAALGYMKFHKSDMTQMELCDLWGIRRRDFRDYARFYDQLERKTFDRQLASFQYILNQAYMFYCADEAAKPITRYIQVIAPLHGIKSRHVCEMWEVDPAFYPSDYAYPRN